MRLLLIDSRVRKYEAFVNACIPNEVEAIVFDFYSDNYESILSKKTQGSYESIALISINYKSLLFQLTIRENHCFLNDKDEFNSWTGFYTFLAGFNTPIVDMMACSLIAENIQGNLWKDVFINLEKNGAINFRASADDTGNLSAGNWVLESDNVNVKDLYFTELISEYNFLLIGQYSDILSWQKSNQLNTNFSPGDIYVWGNPNFGGSPEYEVPKENVYKIDTISNVTRVYSNINGSAFAALTAEGDVWVWGNPSEGGSPNYGTGGNAVKIEAEGFSNIKSIYSTLYSFTALTNTGKVWVWGDPTTGGSPNPVITGINAQEITGLSSAKAIYSTAYSFAALTDTDEVWVWGNPSTGGSPNYGSGGNAVKIEVEGFSNIKTIYSAGGAFAALTNTGDVWVWGNPYIGGSPTYPEGFPPIDLGNVTKIETEGFSNIKTVYSTTDAFAALTNTGDVWVWGSPYSGGSPNYTADGSVDKVEELSSIKSIYSTFNAFAALTTTGDVWVWGSPYSGGTSTPSTGSGNIDKIVELSSIKNIYSTGYAFAALTNTGEVWVWGSPSSGGTSTPSTGSGNIDKIEELSSINSIYSTSVAFAALTNAGEVWVWGNPYSGGSPTYPEGFSPGELGNVAKIETDGFSDIKIIYSTGDAFSALTENGDVFIWGNSYSGGSIPFYGNFPAPIEYGNVKKIIADGFTKITSIYSTGYAFAAILGISPNPPGPSYDIVKPIKNDTFSNLLNYLLYFPTN